MTPHRLEQAVDALLDARRTQQPLRSLPDDCRPASVEEAHAVQDALVSKTGAQPRGWKVNAPSGTSLVTRGIIEANRTFEREASVPTRKLQIVGVEGELAFGFPEGLPPRTRAYTRSEVASAAVIMPALDVVGTRFADFMAVTMFERVADSLNLGAFVPGPALADWQNLDLAGVRAVLSVDGTVISEHSHQHPAGDPLMPAVELANVLRLTDGIPEGHAMTTGSCTGYLAVRPGQTINVEFGAIGAVGVTLA